MHRVFTPLDPLPALIHEFFFLVGPIENAPDWQAMAAERLRAYADVFNPRWGTTPEGKFLQEISPEEKNRQRWWEIIWRDRALVICAYLSNAVDPKAQRLIGRLTRTEIGVHIGKEDRMAIGIEQEFPGREGIVALCTHAGYPVFETLQETCDHAILLMQSAQKGLL